jgi:hypothetical protein
LLCIENEEEVVVEEEVAPQAEIPPVENNSTLISMGQTLSLLQHKASPGAFILSLLFQTLYHLK